MLNSYEAAVDEIVGRHGGSIVKHVGDGTLATFPTGSRAMAGALSIRTGLADLGLDARFGVHVGEIEARGADIADVAVHVAARVMTESSSGQILASATAVGTLAGGPLRFEPIGVRHLKGGVRHLKGIDQPCELHLLIDESAT